MWEALQQWGYLGLFVMLFLGGFGLPIPEDIPLLTAGALIRNDAMGWVPALAVAYTGVVLADSLVYYIGRRSGKAGGKLFTWMGVSTSERVQRIQKLFDRYGFWTVAVARFLPGLRLPVFLYAGGTKMKYRHFLLGDGMAALVSIPAWIAVGYFCAPFLQKVIKRLVTAERFLGIGIAIAVAIVALVWWLRSRKTSAAQAS